MAAREGRFGGKVAVVTGGASGIGAAICRRLVAEGGQVVAADINKDNLSALEAELGDNLVGAVVDVTVESDVAAMVGQAVDKFGGLNLGFNVAGAGRGGLIVDQDVDNFMFTINLCLTGVLVAMKHEARAMIAASGGSIVNVSSLNSRVPMFGASDYCSAKAGAAMLTQVGALELAEHSIRVNAISPGLTDTPLTSMIHSIPGVMDAYNERIPLKRAARPEEIAAAALFLASDDASYISGVNLFVDGGWEQTTYPDLRPFMAAAAQQAQGN